MEAPHGDRQRKNLPTSRWKFSLRTMLLVGTVIVLAVSHLVTTRRLKVTTDEVQKLRQEVGYLDVADPRRIHAVQVPTLETMTWKWKPHLPPGRQYWLHTSTVDIPATGLPDSGQWRLSSSEETITLTVALRKDHLNQWQLVATLRDPRWRCEGPGGVG